MALKIDVTWPAPLPRIYIPIDCRDMTIVDCERATREGFDIAVSGVFGQDNRVHDDDRYRIDHNSQSPLQYCEPCASFERTLAIILESPHRLEYRNNRINQPRAPAQGQTGYNIRDYLMCVIRNCDHLRLSIPRRTRVVLVNPIQFQCSLVSVVGPSRRREMTGKEKERFWKGTRDVVWKALWDQPLIRGEFRSRLARYRPDFIINACTHDLSCRCCPNVGEECRKQKVHDFLLEKFSAHLYSTNHPAAWGYGEGHRRVRFIR